MEDILRHACDEVGLSVAAAISAYDRSNLRDYIDGAAGCYMGYSFDRAAVAEVSEGSDTYVLELYHFTRPEDAYGMWSIDAAGEAVEVGQRSAYGGGLLQFWQGPHFGRVFEEQYRREARDGVMALAQALAKGMGADVAAPALLSEVPREGREEYPVFFHEQPVLNYLYYVSDENLLKLGPETDAVFAAYRRGGGRAKLLLIRHSDEEMAGAAREAFMRGYLEARLDASAALMRLEDGKWTGIGKPVGPMLRVVFGASTREFAEALLTPPG